MGPYPQVMCKWCRNWFERQEITGHEKNCEQNPANKKQGPA